jgi:hypothetical protein
LSGSRCRGPIITASAFAVWACCISDLPEASVTATCLDGVYSGDAILRSGLITGLQRSSGGAVTAVAPIGGHVIVAVVAVVVPATVIIEVIIVVQHRL